MKQYTLANLRSVELDEFIRQRSSNFGNILPLVHEVLQEVGSRGDEALRMFTQKFDGVELSDFRVTKAEFDDAELRVMEETKRAISVARMNIEAFHAAQLPKLVEVQTAPGVLCRREWRPIHRVGLYVPGGSAPLVSTVLMLGVPARLAGCPEIILCTPPTESCTVTAEILYAARTLGITTVFKVGGAQAIAAMALGTESIPKVNKIFGPGNRYVVAAKSLVAQPPYRVAIDLLAGPTELLIIADESANARWIASDLLSQAEHGEDTQIVLVTTSESLAKRVQEEICARLPSLPRQRVIRQTLEKSISLLARNLDEALTFSNQYAPEHLSLAVKDAESLASQVENAGSVFLGSLSSVVLGDYAAGPNHTLPTGGTAHTSGGITVESFMKPVFFQKVSRNGFQSLANTVTTLARAEHLQAHAQAVLEREEKRD